MGKNILVVGGGAIDGMIAAHMTETGYKITLYDTDIEHVKRINEKGLLIDGLKEKKKLRSHQQQNLLIYMIWFFYV